MVKTVAKMKTCFFFVFTFYREDKLIKIVYMFPYLSINYVHPDIIIQFSMSDGAHVILLYITTVNSCY